MIIKGKSRSGPKQLATHLLRADTNERVEILELQSSAQTLGDAFKEWQLIAEGTKGKRGLYHANIDPAEQYSMTASQWVRAVEVLERELGLDGQPRAVVLHEKNGRQHIHVVWQRTDIDTMTLVSDSNNYHAHERASAALEKEFGHDLVPGKHEKRVTDQPIPAAEFNHAEWQQAERSGIAPKAFKDRVTSHYHASDSGSVFVAKLDDDGLVIAKGDRRDFVIVDQAGEVYSLARQIKGVTAKDLRDFMADVQADALPSVAEAKSIQAERPPSPAAEPQEPAITEPPPMETADPQKLEETLKEWHADDMRKLAELQHTERAQAAHALDVKFADQMAQSDAMRAAALEKYDQQAERTGVQKIIDRVIDFVAPTWGENRKAERAEARDLVVAALEKERAEEIDRIEQFKTAELQQIADRHSRQIEEREAHFSATLSRRVRDYEEARRFAERLAEEQRQREQAEQDSYTAGTDPPSRAR